MPKLVSIAVERSEAYMVERGSGPRSSSKRSATSLTWSGIEPKNRF